jgi:RAP1 GTPase activating protein 1
LIRETPGYVIENGSFCSHIHKDFAADNVLFYQLFFIGHEHVNILSKDTPSGPAIISVLKGDENYRVLLRTKEGDQQTQIPRSKIDRGWKSATSRIVKEISPMFATCKWSVLQDSLLKEELIDFEYRMATKKFKVGILLALDTQLREEEMFSNG